MDSHPVLFKHECNVSVGQGIIGGFQNASLRGFYFQFTVSQRRMLYYISSTSYEWVHHYDVVGEQLGCWGIVVKVEDLTQCENRAVDVITAMLRSLNISETALPEMVWKIYSTVHSLGRQVEDIPDARIPVMVDIVRVFQQAVLNPFMMWATPPYPYPMLNHLILQGWWVHAHGDEDEYEEDAEDEEPVPAARSAVAALEKVTLKPKETCSICLGGLMKATRMPCSHVFHQRCIVRWLKKNNACPLCRFKLPTDI